MSKVIEAFELGFMTFDFKTFDLFYKYKRNEYIRKKKIPHEYSD